MEAWLPLRLPIPRSGSPACNFSPLFKPFPKPTGAALHPGSFSRSTAKLALFHSRAVSEDRNEAEADQATPQWQLDFLGADAGNRELQLEEEDDDDDELLPAESMDWCVRVRRSALRSIESRGLAPALERIVSTPKNKKKKKASKKKGLKKEAAELKHRKKQMAKSEDDEDYGVVDDLRDMDDLELRVAQFADGMFDEKRQRNREAFVQTLSRLSDTPSNRSREVSLNRSIVQAQTTDEVLALAAEVMADVAKGLSPSPHATQHCHCASPHCRQLGGSVHDADASACLCTPEGHVHARGTGNGGSAGMFSTGHLQHRLGIV
jgi:hypothetical protein